MSVITLTTDAYSRGNRLAEGIAEKMGYRCIGDDVVIAAAAKAYEIDKGKLEQSLRASTSFFNPLSSRKYRLIPLLEAVLVEQMCQQDLIYQGFIAVSRIQEVSHAIKVRVIASAESRMREVIQKERSSGMVEAKDRIFKLDKERQRWSRAIYGTDISDPALYDLVVNIGSMEDEDVKDVIETIVITARQKKFEPMTYSVNCLKNIALSCRIKAAFIDSYPKMVVRSDKGTVYLLVPALRRKNQKNILAFKNKINELEGVEHVEVYVKKEIFDDIARGN